MIKRKDGFVNRVNIYYCNYVKPIKCKRQFKDNKYVSHIPKRKEKKKKALR